MGLGWLQGINSPSKKKKASNARTAREGTWAKTERVEVHGPRGGKRAIVVTQRGCFPERVKTGGKRHTTQPSTTVPLRGRDY